MSNETKNYKGNSYIAGEELASSHLIATSAAGTDSDGTAIIVNVGKGLVKNAAAVVQISTIEIASNDELYTFHIQGSTSATFASGYDSLASLQVGANEVLAGDQDSDTGEFIIPFRNEKNGVIYPYIRIYCVVAGSIATGGGITYKAFLTSLDGGVN